MKLEPTGERMIVEEYHSTAADHLIYLMHMASYDFVEQYTHGKRVLDYGCGSGYGSARIAETAAHVRAVDVAEEAIQYAQAHFTRPNLVFSHVVPDAGLDFDDASFDVVLSFQVFEHVENTHEYLAEIRRVLRSDGRLILITPDRSTRLFPFQRPWNRWHLKEYSKGGLLRVLEKHFQRVEILSMTARPEVIDIEIRRCRKLKWLTLPITLPVMPDHWRIAALNAIHRRRKRRAGSGPVSGYDFAAEDILIDGGAKPSVNIIAVCCASNPAPDIGIP